MTGKSIAMIHAAVLMAIAVSSGCFSPRYREGIPCGAPDDCPPDQTCAYNVCVACQSVELCNGVVDDDCDGMVDEECDCVDGEPPQTCGLLHCPGQSICVNGRWSACVGAREPGPEICDGLADENCNGTNDDMCPCTPIGGTKDTDCGPCRDGVQRCTLGGLGPCENASPRIDCCPGDTKACGTATGECTTGTEACTSAGRWSGVCSGAGEQPETCNGLDDDCNEMTDELGSCQMCISIGAIAVHDLKLDAGDAEFGGNGPAVSIITTYSVPDGTKVCAQVVVTMQETNGGTSRGSRTVTACSTGVAPGTIDSIDSMKTVNTAHSYIDDDTSAGGVWDFISPQAKSGIASIRCVGDTGGADICIGGASFTDCSKCELLGVCPFVRYRP